MSRTFLLLRMLAAATLVFAAASGWAAENGGRDKPIPSFAEIQQTVLDYFETQDGYKPGDLITQEQVEPLLKQLRRAGLPLPDEKQILESVLKKGDFLVDQLGTPAGRKFMRDISKYPDAYDRLDRLSRLPRGEQTVRDLIRGPDGYKMIEYMTTAAGGKELGNMLSNAPEGKDFDKPTGRSYTAELLLERLEESRAALVKAASRAPSEK